MNYSRRDVAFLLPALAPARAEAQKTATAGPAPSRCYRYEDLPVKNSGGNRTLAVLDGRTHTGYHFDIHETELGPGLAPHPPHHHEHEEMIMIREGALEVTIAGKSTTLGPGSVAYVASNEEHGWRNTGTGRASYFVMAFGRP
ncbi:MAG: cupin domain-containing protein [Acidobacteriota bacterium]|nr:cupin domain-containing protein [Acidobacteriota bacterium]